MRVKSKKQAALERQWGPVRARFLGDFPFCWFCGCYATGVHEITRGSSRLLGFVERATWCSTCSRCNCELLTDYSIWPITRQLAVKLLKDPDYFDLKKVCEIRGRDPLAITKAEVLSFLTLTDYP